MSWTRIPSQIGWHWFVDDDHEHRLGEPVVCLVRGRVELPYIEIKAEPYNEESIVRCDEISGWWHPLPPAPIRTDESQAPKQAIDVGPN